MASTSSTKDDQTNNDQELLGLVKEMRRHIETVDKKVQGLRTLRGQGQEEEGKEINESIVSDIEELYSDHELLKKTFFRLLDEHFTISGEGENHGLKQEVSAEKKLVLGLKIKIQSLKEEEEDLKSKLGVLFTEIQGSDNDTESTSSLQTTASQDSLLVGSATGIDPPQGYEMLSTGFVPSGESSMYSSKRNFEDYQDWNPRLLSKKLRIIKHYYLQQSNTEENRFSSSSSINSGLQNKFGWLRSTKNDEDLDDDDDDPEFEPADIDEMKMKIRGLVRERRKEKAKAREQGKRSLLEYVISDSDSDVGEFTTLNLMHKKARELGDSLSCRVSDMFYVVVETGEACHKFKDHLRAVLRWLDEKGKTPAIRRMVATLQDAEEDLYLRSKIQLYPPLSDVQHRASSAQQEAMDRILDALLREILRLESILSYPNLSEEFLSTTSVELKTFQKILDECEKVVAQIGQEMKYLKAIHRFVSENNDESSIMKSFEKNTAKMVAKAWGSELGQGYNPS